MVILAKLLFGITTIAPKADTVVKKSGLVTALTAASTYRLMIMIVFVGMVCCIQWIRMYRMDGQTRALLASLAVSLTTWFPRMVARVVVLVEVGLV